MKCTSCPYLRFAESEMCGGMVFVTDCNAEHPWNGRPASPLAITPMREQRPKLSCSFRSTLSNSINIVGDKGDLAALLPYPCFLIDDKIANLHAVRAKGQSGSDGFHVRHNSAPDIEAWTKAMREWACQL